MKRFREPESPSGQKSLTDAWYSEAKKKTSGVDAQKLTALYEACGRAFNAFQKSGHGVMSAEAEVAARDAVRGSEFEQAIMEAFLHLRGSYRREYPEQKPSAPTPSSEATPL